MVDHIARPGPQLRFVARAIRQPAGPVPVDPAFWSAIERLQNLLFVTSTAAMTEFNNRHGADFETTLRESLGDRLFDIIPETPEDAFDAVQGLPAELQRREGEITGVVILGDYAAVPARRVECTDLDLMLELEINAIPNAGDDDDAWWVWNDDLYGDRWEKFLPDLPVSRLPIIPARVGAPFAMSESQSVFGLRASEFPFADKIAMELPNSPVMLESPPFAMEGSDNGTGTWAGPILASQLSTDMVYLVLHGRSGADMKFTGTSEPKWRPVAVDSTLVGDSWQAPAVAFGAVCWGALVTNSTARYTEPGETPEPRPIEQSFPLEFIDNGANAFVGFTALHHVPETPVTAILLGAPIHRSFWDNVTRLGMAPAEALFQAKAVFIGSLREDVHILTQAEELKAYWSATCIGFGW